jgi:uroporphyrinogen-III synthase
MIRRVVVTRPVGPSAGGGTFAKKLVGQGFQVFELPILRCISLPLSADSRQKILRAKSTANDSWLVFLSPTAVRVWRELVGSDPDLLSATANALIAVQGSGTADAVLECFGRKANFVPTVFVAEEFALEFVQRVSNASSITVLQSADGRDVFAPTMAEKGFQVVTINTYNVRPEPVATETLGRYREFVDNETAVLFMSPSAVRAATEVLGNSVGTDKIVSIGPITSQALRAVGIPVWREAQEHSEAGVIASLIMGRQITKS